MTRPFAAGDPVRCQTAPGRRLFDATVLTVRPDGSVDVRDPKNGGIRTIRAEHVRRRRQRVEQ